MPNIHADRILILDFGSQYTQLIARRVREAGVYCELHPWDMAPDLIREFAPKGVILSGGPQSVHEVETPRADPLIFDLGVPVLGICYGMQTMAAQLGGSVAAASEREYGYAQVRARGHSRLLRDIEDHTSPEGYGLLDVWMSHGDRVESLPLGFKAIATTDNAPLAGIADEARGFYGVQFHPEVTHTRQGSRIIERFCHEICGCGNLWTPSNIIDDAIAAVREQVGDDEVLLGLSGGVDSSVVAALLHRAIGDKLICVFVDNGLLRLGEGDQVMATFARHMGVRVIRADAEQRFLDRLEGIEDPEQKRKRIGNTFIDVFDEEASKAAQRQMAGPGHHLPGRDRVRRRQDRKSKGHQIPPQRRRPARAHEAQAGRTAARAVQGRGAQARRRTRATRRDGLPAPVPRARPRRAHPRRSAQGIRRHPAPGRPHLYRRTASGRTSTTRCLRHSRCSCRCAPSASSATTASTRMSSRCERSRPSTS